MTMSQGIAAPLALYQAARYSLATVQQFFRANCMLHIVHNSKGVLVLCLEVLPSMLDGDVQCVKSDWGLLTSCSERGASKMRIS